MNSVHVCVCACTYMCMCTCTNLYMRTRVRLYLCVCVYVCVRMQCFATAGCALWMQSTYSRERSNSGLLKFGRNPEATTKCGKSPAMDDDEDADMVQVSVQWKGKCVSFWMNKNMQTATHGNTLQHTATHGNTLQHTATHFWMNKNMQQRPTFPSKEPCFLQKSVWPHANVHSKGVTLELSSCVFA